MNYAWDSNGNLHSNEVNTYTYEHANRLTAVSGPPSAVSLIEDFVLGLANVGYNPPSE